MARSSTEENSERKRISIPKADASVLDWWSSQTDPGLSIRLLIRSEIERNGYGDVAYRPVEQLPRRGRPALVGEEQTGNTGMSLSHPEAPVTQHPQTQQRPSIAPSIVAQREPALVAAGASTGGSSIDDIMNG
ncbi:hypothetical protein SAMN06295974_3765 [Plantibacter flavus]|uniref:Uncharacterized protein n=1 Tax=Plantibacter flavus TaxID=150123 RepID=A0A3N2BLD6_9MICO|nr:hypothetical protein [Plantibacter flavus]ROR76087.1 hypothetical protein EDD42_4040 [Plantibacter flavus]SMG48672.1 hypothetical protein SAMN06295974_3765 [Plantibacter flavus]